MLRLGASVAAAGTVYVATKALRAGYSKATGSTPPTPDDLTASTTRVVVFAIATAALTAIIQVSVQRGVARAISKSEPQEPVAV